MYRNTWCTRFTTITLRGGQKRLQVGKSVDSEASQLGFKSRLCHLPAGNLGNSLSSLCLSFHFCKMGTVVVLISESHRED